MRCLLVCLGLVGAVAAVGTQTLTDDNFDDETGSGVWLLKFYAVSAAVPARPRCCAVVMPTVGARSPGADTASEWRPCWTISRGCTPDVSTLVRGDGRSCLGFACADTNRQVRWTALRSLAWRRALA